LNVFRRLFLLKIRKIKEKHPKQQKTNPQKNTKQLGDPGASRSRVLLCPIEPGGWLAAQLASFCSAAAFNTASTSG